MVRARRAVHCAKELDECARDTRPGVLAQGEEAPLHVLAAELVEAPVEPLRRMAFEASSILRAGLRCEGGAASEVALKGVAKGGDGQRTVFAVRTRLHDGAQHLPGPRAGPGGRERGKVPEHLLAARRPASSLARAVLHDERAKTRWTDAHPKAWQLVVPDDVAMVSGAHVGDGTGREVGLVQRHPASTVWHGGSFLAVIYRVKG